MIKNKIFIGFVLFLISYHILFAEERNLLRYPYGQKDRYAWLPYPLANGSPVILLGDLEVYLTQAKFYGKDKSGKYYFKVSIKQLLKGELPETFYIQEEGPADGPSTPANFSAASFSKEYGDFKRNDGMHTFILFLEPVNEKDIDLNMKMRPVFTPSCFWKSVISLNEKKREGSNRRILEDLKIDIIKEQETFVNILKEFINYFNEKDSVLKQRILEGFKSKDQPIYKSFVESASLDGLPLGEQIKRKGGILH